MEEFLENLYNFEYSCIPHSTDDTNNSNHGEDNDGQTITFETENVEEEIDGPEQIDVEIDKNLDLRMVIDDE